MPFYKSLYLLTFLNSDKIVSVKFSSICIFRSGKSEYSESGNLRLIRQSHN